MWKITSKQFNFIELLFEPRHSEEFYLLNRVPFFLFPFDIKIITDTVNLIMI